MDLLTLDTMIVRDHWDDRTTRDEIDELLQLAAVGEVELAVTAYIRDDVPRDPLASRIRELPALGIRQTVGVWVLGQSRLGVDTRLGDQTLLDFQIELNQELSQAGRPVPGRNDWLHLHTHSLERRDIFLTRDRAILGIDDRLRAVDIVVMSPRAYLDTHVT